VPGGGSAIFVHVWRGGGNKVTAGCTAIPSKDVDTLVTWLKPTSRPVYVLLPQDEFENLQQLWGLPT
jgi:L,D-peptidoglycan transpeptidase YkuD (ErfK/YbiS/YcfS/YnhG family)